MSGFNLSQQIASRWGEKIVVIVLINKNYGSYFAKRKMSEESELPQAASFILFLSSSNRRILGTASVNPHSEANDAHLHFFSDILDNIIRLQKRRPELFHAQLKKCRRKCDIKYSFLFRPMLSLHSRKRETFRACIKIKLVWGALQNILLLLVRFCSKNNKWSKYFCSRSFASTCTSKYDKENHILMYLRKKIA